MKYFKFAHHTPEETALLQTPQTRMQGACLLFPFVNIYKTIDNHEEKRW